MDGIHAKPLLATTSNPHPVSVAHPQPLLATTSNPYPVSVVDRPPSAGFFRLFPAPPLPPVPQRAFRCPWIRSSRARHELIPPASPCLPSAHLRSQRSPGQRSLFLSISCTRLQVIADNTEVANSLMIIQKVRAAAAPNSAALRCAAGPLSTRSTKRRRTHCLHYGLHGQQTNTYTPRLTRERERERGRVNLSAHSTHTRWHAHFGRITHTHNYNTNT